MELNARTNKLFYLLPTSFGVGWLFYFMIKNTVPVDVGDGLMHFFIAQGTWQKPILFLHHWGKPLFSLLSAPFAQFGLNGVIVFNILVYLLSCIGMFKLLTILKVNIWLILLFPLLILIPIDYSSTILAGLTEPLFNLFVIFAGLFLVQKKWIYFAIIVSFMPFLRSEGQLPIVLAFLILAYYKQWRILPYLGLGFLLYALIGLIAIGDFWWYFTTSPYDMSNGIYGVGTWNHYLISYRNYIGNPGLYTVILGVPTAIYLLVTKKWCLLKFDLAFFSGGLFLGIIALHSYFWATGQNGSIGLTRIATQGMPLFLGLMLYYISQIRGSSSKIASVLFIGLLFSLGISLKNTKSFPQTAGALELMVLKSSPLVNEQVVKGRRVFYHFPLLPYLLDENPMLNSKNMFLYYGGFFEKDGTKKFRKGDLLFWESHFGPVEMLLPLERIEAQKEWVLVYESFTGENQLKIYQFIPVSQQKNSSDDLVLKLPNNSCEIAKNKEYTDLFSNEDESSQYSELTADFIASSDGFRLVFDNGNDAEYFSTNLKKDVLQHLTFQVSSENPYKLFIWNPDKVKGEVQVNNKRVIKKSYPPFL